MVSCSSRSGDSEERRIQGASRNSARPGLCEVFWIAPSAPERERAPEPLRGPKILKRALENEDAIRSSEDELAFLEFPHLRGPQRSEKGALKIVERFVACHFCCRDRTNGHIGLHRIGRGRIGVAPAEAAATELFVEEEGRPFARERLVIQADRSPRRIERKDLQNTLRNGVFRRRWPIWNFLCESRAGQSTAQG